MADDIYERFMTQIRQQGRTLDESFLARWADQNWGNNWPPEIIVAIVRGAMQRHRVLQKEPS